MCLSFSSIPEHGEATSVKSAEAEENVRGSTGRAEKPVVQHGADQLWHTTTEGHQNDGGRHETGSQGDEERVQEGGHWEDRGMHVRACVMPMMSAMRDRNLFTWGFDGVDHISRILL